MERMTLWKREALQETASCHPHVKVSDCQADTLKDFILKWTSFNCLSVVVDEGSQDVVE